jgi:hypothetical protein
MIFTPCKLLDAVWARVARATFEGRLGYAAKVSSANTEGKDQHAIWVRTEDFSERKDVKRVLEELGRLQLVWDLSLLWEIYYKCDAYTHLGLSH